jgi:hypothetical protein
MRLTGLGLLIVGLVSAAFTLVQAMTAPVTSEPAVNTARVFPTVQLLLSIVAAVAGVLLLNFGGSGVIKTRDPAVRN